MKMIHKLILAVLLIASVNAKQGDGLDLPSSDPLRIGIKKRGDCSVKSKSGDTLSVHYVGKLYKNNKEFDSSRKRDQPFKFQVGRRNVIAGWDKGMVGMCKGEIRKLTIPSGLGYGDAGAGQDIHKGATLVFDVELLDILPETLTETNGPVPDPWSLLDEEIPDDDDDIPEM